MDTGKLSTPIEFQVYRRTQDPETGHLTASWTPYAEDWARLAGITGREYLAASAQQALTQYRVTIRHRDDIDTTMRIQAEGKIFNIRAILPDDRRKWLVMMCEEGVNEG